MKTSLTKLAIFLIPFTVISCGGGSSKNSMELSFPKIKGINLVSHIEPVDLNGDGLIDAIIAASDGYHKNAQLIALINTGNGLKHVPSYFPKGLFSNDDSWIESIYMIDLNDDGHLDIVPHYDVRGSLPPLLWDEEKKHFVKSDIPATEHPGYIPIDINGAGLIDFLVPKWGSNEWLVIKNDGNSFALQENPIFTTTSNNYMLYYPLVFDVDNDGRLDVIFSGPAREDGWVNKKTPLTVMLNKETGWVQASHSDMFIGDTAEFTHLRIMKLADFNGDDHLDIFIANHGYDAAPFTGEYNAVLMNNGNGTFTVNTQSDAVNYRGFTHALAVGDINNDGRIDVVVADVTGKDVNSNKTVRVLYNNGNGNFTSKSLKSKGQYTATALIDVNGDGYLDLILGGMDKDNPSTIILNSGKGDF